jgi:hypothetical protein
MDGQRGDGKDPGGEAVAPQRRRARDGRPPPRWRRGSCPHPDSGAGVYLYNEFRAGYRFDFNLGRIPLFSSVQYVYGFGLYPGNKPRRFISGRGRRAAL